MTRIFSLKWMTAVLLGVILGSYLSEADSLNRLRFSIWPVVTMTGEIVSKNDSEVIIRMFGTKHRGEECRFEQIQAMGKRLAGPTVDLNIVRQDMESRGSIKPRGVYDIGIWKIWPTSDIVSVKVYVSHTCNDKLWATEIADLKLKE